MRNSKLKKCLSVLLALGTAASPVLATMPIMAVETNDDSQTREVSDLRALVNPVLQVYEPAQTEGTWTLEEGSFLAIAATEENMQNEELQGYVRLISSELKDKGLTTDFVPVRFLPADSASGSEIHVNIDANVTDRSTSPEAYKIEISESGIKLTGASEVAVLHGLHTIEALLITNRGVPYGTIIDYPRLNERRIHVDCARKYISKDWFIRLIHEMSYMKYNALQMHFSENLGFRIECETDPAIVSDQYLTKDEVREILAEAKKYGISVIPSFDSPGHVDQILKAHPEYGQISSNGTHYEHGLDVTNPEAVEYIKSLYAEYCELFEGCTDFHIGGDEYMEFDRAPFTTQYRSVLNSYAQEKYGAGYSWKDTMSGYINEIAEFVHDRGFTPRIWNDGVYYGEHNESVKQKIEMHDYIGIDFWSQMGWNRSIAKLQTFIDKGHKTIYNFNSSYFYYVLRSSKPSDGREQHSFDNLNSDRLIYEDYTPGKFSSNTIADDHEVIAGSSIGIWCDIPDLVTEDVIMEDISKEMRALASKGWNTSSPDILPFEEFKTLCQTLGHAGAYTKGEKLPEGPEILPSDDLGSVVLHYVDANGETIAPDRTVYGKLDTDYSFEPAAIYGYRATGEAVSGKYAPDTAEYTFRYELYTDWTELDALLADLYAQDDLVPRTWPAYKEALDAAVTLKAAGDVHQRDVDAATAALRKAYDETVTLDKYALDIELSNPLPQGGYAGGYAAYQQALENAREVLADKEASKAQIADAKSALDSAREGLVRATNVTPTVTSSVGPYSTYGYANMFDKNDSTKFWANGPQVVGDHITFTFAAPVNLSAIRIKHPLGDNEKDYIYGADVEVSADGVTWNKVGEYEGSSRDTTVEFEKQSVKAIRLVHTVAKDNWTQITEVEFAIHTSDNSGILKEKLAAAGEFDPAQYTLSSFTGLIDAMTRGQAALGANSDDMEARADDIQNAIDALVRKSDPSDLFTDILDRVIGAAMTVIEKADFYSPERFEGFDAAVDEAKSVRDNAKTQDELDSQALSLNRRLLEQRLLPDETLLENSKQ